MAFDGIEWDVIDHTRALDELDRIIMVDRFVADMDAAGATVTPTIRLNNTDITLTAITSTGRAITEQAINRIGPVDRFQMDFAITDAVRWFNIDLDVRALDLGINILPNGNRIGQRGRSIDPTVRLTWDINPFSLPADARATNTLIQRLYVDAVTGAQTITPVLEFHDGTTSSLAGITAATRTVTEFAIGTTQRLRQLRLDGDFTQSAIIVFDVEIDLYIPPSHLI